MCGAASPSLLVPVNEGLVIYTGVPPVNVTEASWVCVAGRPEFCTAVFEDNTVLPVVPISESALIDVPSIVRISFILSLFEQPSPAEFPFHHSALNHTTPVSYTHLRAHET